MKNRNLLLAVIPLSLAMSCQPKWQATTKGELNYVENDGGQNLAYSTSSGVKLIEDGRYAFKDLNRNGSLDIYEDWRLSYDERAKDLASQLTIEEIAGLMLYSSHQSIPARAGGYFAGTYDGKPYEEGVTDPTDLTDQQKKFLKDDNLRHVLLTTVKSPEVAAQWNNKMQAFCEAIGKGIPANNSSDPRNGTRARAEYDAASGGEISMWPSSLGMAATFDPSLVEKFGQVASEEYRALGITTALSPQVDIATEPRWGRFNGTFGESPLLSAAMAAAYVNGFQTSNGERENQNGWGLSSVNAMVKHWPGGGAGEAGRDAHYGNGKYAVYPGDNFEQHLIPFTEGAFKLSGKTKMASAVMPYYTISWNQDKEGNENVGNVYNKHVVTDLLRGKYNYDGVVCTDWGVTGDHNVMDSFIDGKSWGVEGLSIAERHYKILMAGADQFGGNNDMKPILVAYEMGIKELGEEKMRARMEQSAVRLLKNIFRVGVFENPYLDVEVTNSTVGKPEFMQAGYEAQLASVVMLKNASATLPIDGKKTVFVPKRFVPGSVNFLGMESPSSLEYPLNMDLVKKYFNTTDNPEEADFALVLIQNPSSGIGYSKVDVENGGNGYLPISLQYADDTASEARSESVAGGDPLEAFANRTYKDKSVKTSNFTDAQLVNDTKKKMGDKPVVLIVNTTNPLVLSEIEPASSSLLISFGLQDQALLDIISGKAEPKALLPMQMPADMASVEKQAEDLPFDLNVYKDSEEHAYDFAFGMNWQGVISDERVSSFK